LSLMGGIVSFLTQCDKRQTEGGQPAPFLSYDC
jgi:hypothetical protein